MPIEADWTIDYSAKTITHTSGTTVYTVNELYSWLMDLFDELAQMDDPVPMSAQTPTEYTLINGWMIPDASMQYLKTGAIKTEDGNSLWSNIYTLGSIQGGTQIYVAQNGVVFSSWWAVGHIDVLIKVKDAGSLIDSGYVTVFARELTDLYDNFKIDLSSGGRNAVPLATSDDLNNQSDAATLGAAPYSNITITFGTVAKDLNNGNGAVNYDVVVDCAGLRLSQVYERLKYVCRRGETTIQLNGVDGEQYKAADPSYTEVKASPFGTFAGGKFFGARGVWIENYDATDAKSFQLIDASGATQTPPNVVSVIVTSVAVGDRVLVAKLTAPGGEINTSQYSAAVGNDLGDGTVVVSEGISPDTPSSGTVRIDGDRYPYLSWSGSTFTLDGVTLTRSYNAGDDVYVPIVDGQASSSQAANTLTYSADIPVLVRVRKKGILPFEVETKITSAGLSVAAIRNTDNIVS